MRELPRPAQLYLYLCYLLGLSALGWLLMGDPFSSGAEDWLLGALLALAAGAAQVLTVARAKSHYSDHLTPAPVFAALLLLPSPVLALVVVFAFVPEWVYYRRKWYIQLFNISSWLAATVLGRWALASGGDAPRLEPAAAVSAVSILAALLLFLGTQTMLLALVLKLARGESFRESGLFAPPKLFSDMALLCSGWAFAAAWLVDPLYAIAAAVPLLIIFQALHVPNLKEEAATDPKTGLANMRHFNGVFTRELARATQSGQPLSLLMCDLDHLRNINNTYGHQAGDLVIAGVADAIRHTIRGCDLAGRFGGEEFVVLLADCDRAHAGQVAERLRATFEQYRFDIGAGHAPIGATVSIGVASVPADGREAEAVMREADLALYQAKRDGRNRVIAANRTSRELVGEWAREHLVAGVTGAHPRKARGLEEALPDGAAPSSSIQRGTPAAAPPKPPGAAQRPGGRPTRMVAFISLVVVLGLLAVVPGLLIGPPLTAVSWPGLALFAILVIVAHHLAVDMHRRGKTSVAAVAILGASLLYHELGILVVAVAFAVWAKVQARSPLHRMLFNLGDVMLAAAGARWVFNLLAPGPLGDTAFEQLVVPAAVAGLVYFVINNLLICVARGLTEARPLWEIWRESYQWLWPHYVVLGVLSLVVALGYVTFGWAGVIALTAPVAMMHLAIKQYMDRTAEHVDELQRVNGQLRDSYEATLEALSRALDTRDEETEEHSRRVRRYTELIARHYGLPAEQIEHLSRGALLHDIGKIGVPDAILLKPGRLSDDEYAVMQRHPTIGFSMIAHIPFLAKAAEVVLHHHEAYDGSGYPSGLAGTNIPLGARIFAVVDALDAMTTDRPYRQALPYPEALVEIQRCQGQQFDPQIVDVVLAIPIEELIACGQEVSPPAEPAAIWQQPLELVAS